MCEVCDWQARQVVWCEECEREYDRPCPRCGGQRGCPLGHNSGTDVDCFWCAADLGPGAKAWPPVDGPVKRSGQT